MTTEEMDGGLAAAAAAEPEVVTAELVITERPEAMTQAEVDRLHAVATDQERMVAEARALAVTTEKEQVTAVEFLAQLKRQRRETDEARKFLTKPLQDHVSAIIGRFRPHEEALTTAIDLVTGKVQAYQAEQERKRQEMQAKLDREREEREAELRRQAAEAEAEARRVREEAEAEASRRAEEARREAEAAAAAAAAVAEELRAEMGALPESALQYQAKHGSAEDRRQAAQAELDHRERARAAEKAEKARVDAERERQEAEQAEQERRAATERSIAALPSVKVAGPSGPVRSASGSASSRGVWKFELLDIRALCAGVANGTVDPSFVQVSTELGKAVRRASEPVRELPGVRIYDEKALSVRSTG